MANWCQHHLSIMVTLQSINDPEAYPASRAELERFKNGLDASGKGVMETFLPMPEKCNDTVHDHANSVTADDGKTWFDWQLENWGAIASTSDMEALEVGDIDDDELILTFQTPWDLPVAGLATISKLFPTLEFLDDYDYVEDPSGQSKGYLRVRDGEVAWSEARIPALRGEATEGTAGD